MTEQIIISLIAVHFVTVICFLLLKRTRISEELRSSQSHPANLGNTALQVGGVVIVPVTLGTAIILLHLFDNIPVGRTFFFAIPMILLFAIGFVDDFHPISARIRLGVHLANATWITILVYQLTQFSGLAGITSTLGIILPSVLMVLAISWMINTTNFIDGMDLFLVATTLPGSLLFSLLYLFTGQDIAISVVASIFLSSLIGFIWFNRPKASVYMGDAGSLCIGSLLGGCSVFILAKYGSIAGFLPFVFILVDTTFTLFNNILNGKNPMLSHSRHAYQVAAKNGKSENQIRMLSFLVSVANTGLAYLCFEFQHQVFWQISFGLITFLLSTALFFYLHNSSSTKANKTA